MRKLLITAMVLGLLLFGSQAYADLSITPAWTPVWFGNETNQDVINESIAPHLASYEGTLGVAAELYKQNVGGSEEGSFKDFYKTEFFETPSDPSAAEISWIGPSFIDAPQFLLVKDGAQTPAWYLFDLTTKWNGKETLQLSGFWPQQGGISHVSLYGTVGFSVPEPGSLMLLGMGLIGVGVAARRRMKK